MMSYINHFAERDLKRTELLIGGQEEAETSERQNVGQRVEAFGQIDRIEWQPIVAILNL